MNQNDLIKRINENYPKLSKGQRLLANYIIKHYEKAVFLTAAKLGKIVGVSESTVVRFANELGYDGYPKLQRALEELVKNKLTSIQRMEVASDRINKQHILKSVLQSDAEKIRYTLEDINAETFDQAVDMILSARKIYILGVRSSAALASFLGFYFNLIFDNVKLIHTNSVSEMFEQIYRMGPEDVVIGISFPRYSKRTLKAMEFARSRDANVITITDSSLSPMIPYANLSLLARSDMASFVDSLVAPLSVINALIVALCMKKQKELINTLQSLESIWEEYQVYDKNDDDINININYDLNRQKPNNQD
ncbi:RpiR family transcriptional regulator [Natranaerovirga pectinivora]|uniref:RpiR family transcriptional regulator n=1 Tax=Natranaerovirga pectinivora TaxID=682400 RepID=A0A4R3MMD4_9FIRM|nr:MurR/RpiR family transcriptional regulator [Natranaerovirga pectinivora]TCT15005.1 RpiR family transcriptional regulator [Natranaerovirga pectinivora]